MLVLDASVIVELLRRTPDGERVERRAFGGGERLHVPHLLDVEVAQALRRFARVGALSERRGRLLLRLLGELPLTRHSHARLAARVWALRDNLCAYDATYVALAESLGATLLTRDARVARAPGVHAKIEVM